MEVRKDNTQIAPVAPEVEVVMVPVHCGDEIILRQTTNTSPDEDKVVLI